MRGESATRLVWQVRPSRERGGRGNPLRDANGARARRVVLLLAFGALALMGLVGCGSAGPDGAELFAANCAACHGKQAEGTDAGPPLVHRLYVPGHHSDAAFQSAVKNGVFAHHWDFGDMPAVAGVSEDEVAAIVRYVRGLQLEAGLIE